MLKRLTSTQNVLLVTDALYCSSLRKPSKDEENNLSVAFRTSCGYPSNKDTVDIGTVLVSCIAWKYRVNTTKVKHVVRKIL